LKKLKYLRVYNKMQETKEILKQVRRVEIITKHLVDGLIVGNYNSIFRGKELNFLK